VKTLMPMMDSITQRTHIEWATFVLRGKKQCEKILFSTRLYLYL
jgi:hypothetical protein